MDARAPWLWTTWTSAGDIQLAAPTPTPASCNEKARAPNSHATRTGWADSPNRVGGFSRDARTNSPKCAPSAYSMAPAPAMYSFAAPSRGPPPRGPTLRSAGHRSAGHPAPRKRSAFGWRLTLAGRELHPLDSDTEFPEFHRRPNRQSLPGALSTDKARVFSEKSYAFQADREH